MNQYFWKSESISIHFNPFSFAGLSCTCVLKAYRYIILLVRRIDNVHLISTMLLKMLLKIINFIILLLKSILLLMNILFQNTHHKIMIKKNDVFLWIRELSFHNTSKPIRLHIVVHYPWLLKSETIAFRWSTNIYDHGV